MSEHPIAQKIIDELNAHDAWNQTFEHKHVRTSEEAAAARVGFTLSQGTKALIVRMKVKGEGKKFFMLVMQGDKKFDSKKAKAAMKANDLRFANAEEVEEITGGVKPGGVPPFGNLFGIPVVVDPGVFTDEDIIFNAGRNYSIAMKSTDYKRIVEPIEANIVA